MAAHVVTPRRPHAPRPTRQTPTRVVSRLDLAGLDRIERVEQIGPQTVVARTTEGREVRITAKRDLRAGKFRAEYERRATLEDGDKTYMFWSLTPAHARVIAADAKTCLEHALRDVNSRYVS